MQFLTIALLIHGTCLQAQEFSLRQSINLDFAPIQLSVDKKGQLYLADAGGSIYKYDAEGTLLNLYSTKQLGKIYLLEALHGLRVLAFYQDLQEILLTDRFLANERKFSLESMPYVRLATLAQDQGIWLLLERDLTLQKIRLSDNYKLIENQWANDFTDGTLEVNFMKEYKNRLYLYDNSSRAIVFDNMGNLMANIDSPGSSGIFFDEDNLYFIHNASVEIIDLNTFNKRQINLPQKIDKAQISGRRAYLIFENTLSIYDYNPL